MTDEEFKTKNDISDEFFEQVKSACIMFGGRITTFYDTREGPPVRHFQVKREYSYARKGNAPSSNGGTFKTGMSELRENVPIKREIQQSMFAL